MSTKKNQKKNRCIEPTTFCDLVSELGQIEEGEVGRVDFSKLSSKEVAKSVLELFGIESEDIGENKADFFIATDGMSGFLKSIGRYCDHNNPLIDTWVRSPTVVVDEVVMNNLYNGIDLLYDMEYKRVYKNKDDKVLDRRKIILLVIKSKVKGQRGDKYLFIYNRKALRYQMVGGYQADDLTPEENAVKKLEKELINFKYDPEVHSLKRVQSDVRTVKLSRRRGLLTEYTIDVFQLQGLEEELDLNESFKWVGINEIVNGISSDGYSLLWVTSDNEEEGIDTLRNLGLSSSVKQNEGVPLIKNQLSVTETRKRVRKFLSEEESKILEFKSSIRWDYSKKQINKDLEKVIMKTLVAFLNSEGGSLVMGVSDEHEILGLNKDIRTLRSKNVDGLLQYLTGLFSSFVGSEYTGLINISPIDIGEKTICLITAERSEEPVFYTEGDVSSFFIRVGNTTRQLNSKETYKYILRNWENS